jgi:acyl-CoA reductase-like NAD-dependent aldehyde dehydrogenase
MSAVIDLQTERANDIHAPARAAQTRWASNPIAHRVRVVRELRHLLAENAEPLAIAVAATNDRSMEEKLVSEVLPLADACRWLKKNAARLLAPRRSGSRGCPFWLRGFSFEVQRQPFGLVLVIGPGNYPLFLPAVHSLHALVAGNAVLFKPAPGARNIALFFAKLARDAGLDPALLTILPESVDAARDAIAGGVDKVIFTGSSENGRDVLADLATSNTPAVMELSGEDAVLVFADADLDLVVRALDFGARLNNGRTCIAPRRLIVVQSVADDLLARMAHAHIPRLLIERVRDEATAVLRANAADFALGASIFSRDVARARSLAARIKTGFVLINDLIAPTADPRMPFGGIKASGFGTTRGDEGLLEMTFPHVVAVRSGNSYRHFGESDADDAKIFSSYIRAVHGRRGMRFSALRDLSGALLCKIKNRKTNS